MRTDFAPYVSLVTGVAAAGGDVRTIAANDIAIAPTSVDNRFTQTPGGMSMNGVV